MSVTEMPPEPTDEQLRARARYLAALVQGSQALEGAAVDAAGFERLVELAVALLRARTTGPFRRI